MKINIWIKKEEVLSGNITKYYTQIFNTKLGYEDYVQVSITTDEFSRLEDNNCNFDLQKNPRAQYSKLLDNASAANRVGGMIHERNPDTGDIKSRKINSHNSEIKTSTTERSEDGFEKFVFALNGGEFVKWHESATEEEKDKYNWLLNNRKNKRK